MSRSIRGALAAVLGLGALALVARDARAQHAGHAPAPPAGTPRTYTMEELHRSGGVPRGWKFALPQGDAARGREVFAQLECFKCHAVKGERFPASGGDATSVGPELTGMGGQHPAEYLAESILAPNAVIVAGPGFTGADGRSIMPSYADALSVTQLVDLVAYVKSLTGSDGHTHARDAATRERSVGDYVVRLEYAAKGGHAGDGAHAGHAHGAAPSAGHLMVFVSDASTGESVPYLPVSVTLRAKGGASRTLKLLPMVGGQGFHYGVSVSVPGSTSRLAVTIGRTTMRVMPSAAGRFSKPVTVEFEWQGS
ncbi:MAG: iron transporter [Candidatus Rokuibacteriota bacterium]